MPKVKISKQLIEMIANKNDSEFVRNINEKVNQLLTMSIENLSKKVSYISLDNVVLQPANEIFNNSFVDGSDYIYLLGIENAQLQLNTIKQEGKWKHFKKKMIFFWKNRKALKKKKKRRRKKKKEEEKAIKNLNLDFSKYTIYDFCEDLQYSLSNNLSETSMIYLDKNVIQIIGKEDLGTNVNITIHVVSLENQVYKYFKNEKAGFIDINILNRYHFLNEKQVMLGENFSKILKIINGLYFNINGKMPNQIFIESILCSCPDELFEGKDIYSIYLKIINYLSLKTIKNIKSINEPTKTIFEDNVCGKCAMPFMKMLEEIGKDKI